MKRGFVISEKEIEELIAGGSVKKIRQRLAYRDLDSEGL